MDKQTMEKEISLQREKQHNMANEVTKLKAISDEQSKELNDLKVEMAKRITWKVFYAFFALVTSVGVGMFVILTKQMDAIQDSVTVLRMEQGQTAINVAKISGFIENNDFISE